jgi:hypothetical protein
MQQIDERATKEFMKRRLPTRAERESARSAQPSDPLAMSGQSLWTIGVALLAFQVVVVVGFATVGLTLTLRPTV